MHNHRQNLQHRSLRLISVWCVSCPGVSSDALDMFGVLIWPGLALGEKAGAVGLIAPWLWTGDGLLHKDWTSCNNLWWLSVQPSIPHFIFRLQFLAKRLLLRHPKHSFSLRMALSFSCGDICWNSLQFSSVWLRELWTAQLLLVSSEIICSGCKYLMSGPRLWVLVWSIAELRCAFSRCLPLASNQQSNSSKLTLSGWSLDHSATYRTKIMATWLLRFLDNKTGL